MKPEDIPAMTEVARGESSAAAQLRPAVGRVGIE